jgi:Putative Actinobacterial Holin-X, holin superfamily III
VKQLSEQVSRLVRDELRLAQLEMTRKGKSAGAGIGLAGGGGLMALYGLGALIAGAVVALSLVLAAWLAALIAGAVLLLIAAILALLGKRQLQRATPPVPADAAGSIKADVKEIKERARR